MRHSLLSGLLLFFILSVDAQNYNISKLGSLDYQTLHNSDVSDIWGYVDGSMNEYAIVGVNDTGVSIVDVTDPANPVEVYYSEEQASTTWRDIKTVNDHAYIVNEGGGGMKIIDLSTLPSNTNLNETTYTAGGMFTTAHNIYIDSDSVAYIFGSDHGAGGVIMLDLSSDPMNPSVLGTYDPSYVHDGMVRNDTLYACHVNDGYFAIVDVSNPSSPQVLGTHATPNDFTHNAWVSDDGDHLYTTDEVSDGFIGAYDVSDPSNIQELDRIQVTPGSGSIPHNTHFMNEYLITSYYRDGVVIHDVSNPDNMVETARFDVAPGLSGDGFDGAWGVYPYLPSGNLIVSDIGDGLHILGPNYERGCYLEGTITEQSSGNPINGAICRIEPAGNVDKSDITGSYANGIGNPGTYNVIYEEPTYFPDTAFNVPLSRDSLTIRDIQLQKRPSYTIRFEFIDNMSGNPIQGSKLSLRRNSQKFNGPNYNGVSNNNGAIELSGVYQGNYALHAGNWGHQPYCQDSLKITGPDTVVISLDKGYGDDFAVDLGWKVNSSSNTGHWERGEPLGTSYQGFPLNPEEDLSGDCGEQAYVTGNQGTGPSDDQVDTLNTILSTPQMDLSGYNDPVVEFNYWFASASSFGVGNDSMFVRLDGAGYHLVLDTITGYEQTWQFSSLTLSPYHPFGDSVQIKFVAEDIDGGSITEAGIDHFRVSDATSVNEHSAEKVGVKVMPVPFKEHFMIRWKGSSRVDIRLYDLQGRSLRTERAEGSSFQMNGSSLDQGVYILRVMDASSGELLGRKRVIRE